jgi:hypothetical protein
MFKHADLVRQVHRFLVTHNQLGQPALCFGASRQFDHDMERVLRLGVTDPISEFPARSPKRCSPVWVPRFAASFGASAIRLAAARS